MEPAWTVALLWLLFGGAHIGLATRRVRATLVAALGEWGFMGLFSLVAAVTFTLAVNFYATHRLDGAPGLALGAMPALRGALMAAVVIGVVLWSVALLEYPRGPMALFGDSVRAPYGFGRITRHGFFVGVALMAAAHALLATRLVGTVLFGGVALFALLGAWHQDRKLLILRGAPYAEYLAATSTVPFAAILTGRQHIAWRELSASAVLAGIVTAIALRTVHGSIFAHGGAWVVGAVLAGAALETLQAWRRAHHRPGSAHLASRTT